MEDRPHLHLFEGFGIELEYMIVDRDSLCVAPLCDRLLSAVCGRICNEVEVGPLCWSNELVQHVVELKTRGPASSLAGLAEQFQAGVAEVDGLLSPLRARLLPTAMHPWMAPAVETVLWPHDNSPIYAAYNRIFDCRGHGWSNLQSMHINLPFCGDEEFGRLHAAIRLLLPLLPALAASSPVVEGCITGILDTRLDFYRRNQEKIPSITGGIVPEPVYTKAAYLEELLAPIYRDISPFDPEGILQEEWLNSRGAIARFERNTVEIRLLDIQECPAADLAFAALIVELLRRQIEEAWRPTSEQMAMPTKPLADLLVDVVRYGESAPVGDRQFLALWGWEAGETTAGGLLSALIGRVAPSLPADAHPPLELLLREGNLARRIVKALGAAPERRRLEVVYCRLADCLAQGALFHG